MTTPGALRSRMACSAIVIATALAVPATALAHGGDLAGGTAMSDAGKIRQLALEPSRVLAQQALVTLMVAGDVREAAVRLDAALESKDRSDIDFARLQQATETLDAGNAAGAVPILDEALSRPLGSDRGKALHEAGREFTAETGTQEIVGTALGGVLLLLGAIGLRRRGKTAVGS